MAGPVPNLLFSDLSHRTGIQVLGWAPSGRLVYTGTFMVLGVVADRNDCAFAGSSDKKVRAFDVSDGRQLASYLVPHHDVSQIALRCVPLFSGSTRFCLTLHPQPL
jgi:hypothetical protein